MFPQISSLLSDAVLLPFSSISYSDGTDGALLICSDFLQHICCYRGLSKLFSSHTHTQNVSGSLGARTCAFSSNTDTPAYLSWTHLSGQVAGWIHTSLCALSNTPHYINTRAGLGLIHTRERDVCKITNRNTPLLPTGHDILCTSLVA